MSDLKIKDIVKEAIMCYAIGLSDETFRALNPESKVNVILNMSSKLKQASEVIETTKQASPIQIVSGSVCGCGNPKVKHTCENCGGKIHYR